MFAFDRNFSCSGSGCGNWVQVLFIARIGGGCAAQRSAVALMVNKGAVVVRPHGGAVVLWVRKGAVVVRVRRDTL